MKNLLFLLIVSSLFGACDIVEEPFKTNTETPVDTTNPTTFIKKILMEDYSGHTCSNCPNAAKELDALIAIYGKKIVPITIHVGKSYAGPKHISQAPKYQYDFRTETGESWNNYFQITNLGLPKGMINRAGYPNSHGIDPTNWHTILQTIIDEEPDFGMTISPNIGLATVDINIKVLNDIQGDLNLLLCLTEDSIINWQKDINAHPEVDVESYVHKHVFRGSINSLWGDPLQNNTSYIQGDQIIKTYDFDLDSLQQNNIDHSLFLGSNSNSDYGNGNSGGWVKENMYIVAFIYDNTTFEIQQVEEVPLITP